jgi:hypothetical protein
MYSFEKYHSVHDAIQSLKIDHPLNHRLDRVPNFSRYVIEHARQEQQMKQKNPDSYQTPQEISKDDFKRSLVTAIELAYRVGHAEKRLDLDNHLDKTNKGFIKEHLEGIGQKLIDRWKEELELLKTHLPDRDGHLDKAIRDAQMAGRFGAELTVDQVLESRSKHAVGSLNDKHEATKRTDIKMLLNRALNFHW